MLRRLIPKRLKSRLLLTYLVVMVLGLGGLIICTGLRLQGSILEQQEHNLELQAALIANAFQEPLHEIAEEDGSDEAGDLNALV